LTALDPRLLRVEIAPRRVVPDCPLPQPTALQHRPVVTKRSCARSAHPSRAARKTEKAFASLRHGPCPSEDTGSIPHSLHCSALTSCRGDVYHRRAASSHLARKPCLTTPVLPSTMAISARLQVEVELGASSTGRKPNRHFRSASADYLHPGAPPRQTSRPPRRSAPGSARPPQYHGATRHGNTTLAAWANEAGTSCGPVQLASLLGKLVPRR